MASTPKTILFLGATGGCALAALQQSLSAQHTCLALARTPSKLLSLLAPGTASPTAPSNLIITQGDATSSTSILTALRSSPSGVLPDVIVSGIGGAPRFQASLTQPLLLDNPHICETATRAVLTALTELQAATPGAKKPVLVVISSTGVPNTAVRDYPLLLAPMYRWMLAVPAADKIVMERALAEEVNKGAAGVLGGGTVVKASLLTDGAARGTAAVRVSATRFDGEPVSEHGEQVLGYTISRADVGAWIFEECVRGDGRSWSGRTVTVTY